ncbi:MAG: hypothetical protein AUJ55_00915 [Proteobacteria bacterium CG1_02_64_396]|nr:MAG: hypothetical protein AUJ55_00915 [Proteobacteria bacterium CG1_02_64_396]
MPPSQNWPYISGDNTASFPPARPPRPLYFALLFLGLACLPLLFGSLLVRLHGPQLQAAAIDDLRAIADLKAAQIERWLAERRADAEVVAHDADLIDRIAQMLTSDAPLARQRVGDHLAWLQHAYGYNAILLLDATGQVVMQRRRGRDEQEMIDPDLLALAWRTGTIQRSDIYHDPVGEQRLDWVIPLLSRHEGVSRPLAAIVLHTPPADFLFPLIQTWPTPSSSAETVLMRRDGEDVIYLNELRHRHDRDARLHLPLKQAELASAALRDNRPRTLAGRDYRGVEVLAAFHSIQGTPWLLEAKIDRAEVLVPLDDLTSWAVGVAMAAALGLAIAAVMLWRQQQRAADWAHRAQLSERDHLLTLFYDLPLIGMAIAPVDSKRWLHVNDRLCQMLGYTAEELTALTWDELTHPDDLGKNLELFQQALRGEIDSYSMDKRYLRKNGSTVYTELHVQLVRNSDHSPKFFVATVQDITSRKQAEARLEALNRLYATLSATNKALVHHRDLKSVFDEICRVAVDVGGFGLAWIGRVDEEGKSIEAIARAGEREDYLQSIHIVLDDPIFGQGPTGRAARRGLFVLCNDIATEPRMDPWREQLQRHGLASTAAFPIVVDEKTWGVLSLYSQQTCFFDDEEVNLLDEMAEDIGLAIELEQLEQKRLAAESELRAREALFHTLARMAPVGITRYNANGMRIYGNERWSQITGMERTRALGDQWLACIHTTDRPRVREAWQEIVAQGEGFIGEYRVRRPDGTIVWVYDQTAAERDNAGAISGFVGTLTDISALKEGQAQLNRLTYHDTLTGLPNRDLFQSRLEHAVLQAQPQGDTVAVLLIDLDHFKQINDGLGHPAGDLLLKQVAERMRRRLHPEDTLARLGGDEFAVLIEHLDHVEEGGRIAQGLIEVIDPPFVLEGGHEVFVTASVGISLFPNHGSTAHTLMQFADTAMYQAKNHGRHSFRYYTDALTQTAMRRLSLENKLRRALEKEAFEVYYQPQIDLKSGRIVGAEALLRWTCEGSPIPPSRFIPIAEETGLINPLGEWVLRNVCRQGQIWRSEGLEPILLAVNLSPRQFTQSDLFERVEAILAESGLPPHWLEIELTESALMSEGGNPAHLLDRLKSLGLHLSLDDFGTGYSSLSYLRRFPLDSIKIDRSLVRDIPHHADDLEIVSAIIGLAHNLGLTVVGEGIETREQLETLRGKGCDRCQGYLFSKAVPAQEFAALLREPARYGLTSASATPAADRPQRSPHSRSP